MSRRVLSRTSKQRHRYKRPLPLSQATRVRLHAPEQRPEGRSGLKGNIQILSLIGEHQTTHTRVSDLCHKLLNLPQLWLKMPMLRLRRAEPGTAAKALGCSGCGAVCTASPHTSSAQVPLSKWEGCRSPSPDAEQSPCMGSMIHSSSAAQGWSCVAALTHEQPVVTWAPSARRSGEKPPGTLLTNLSQQPSHGLSTYSDQYLNDSDSIRRPSSMH